VKPSGGRLPFAALLHPKLVRDPKEFMKKAISAFQLMTTIAGAASLLYAGYIILNSLPDLRRYIKMSTM
jgi:uncharacterized protein DUF6893